MSQDDLLPRIESWLERTGYPLEMRTTRRFRLSLDKKWDVEPSHQYPDVETSENREIDVVVDWMYSKGQFNVWCVIVIECKNSDSPWVVLKSTELSGDYQGRPLDPYSIITLKEVNGTHADSLIQTVSQALRETTSLPLTTGYSVVEAFKKSNERDISYKATSQAVAAARYYTHEQLRNPAGVIGSGAELIVTLPVVVTTARLFDATLDAESDRVDVSEVDSTLVRVAYTSSEPIPSCSVLLTTELGLQELLNYCTQVEQVIPKYFRRSWPELYR